MASITLPNTITIDPQGTASLFGVAGEAIAQGQLVYQDSTTKKIYLARANVIGTKACIGIARNGASINAPIEIAIGGLLSGASGLTKGLYYVLSAATAGAIAPTADLASTNYNVLFGLAISATQIKLDIKDFSVVMP